MCSFAVQKICFCSAKGHISFFGGSLQVFYFREISPKPAAGIKGGLMPYKALVDTKCCFSGRAFRFVVFFLFLHGETIGYFYK